MKKCERESEKNHLVSVCKELYQDDRIICYCCVTDYCCLHSVLSNQFGNEMSQRPKINSTFVKFQQWPVFLWSANHCSLWILISGAFDVLSGPFVTSRLQLCNGVLKILHNKGQPNHSQCWMVLTHELELEWSCWQVEPVWLADNGMLTVGKCTCLSILDDVLWKMQICRNRRTHEPKQTLPHCNVNKQCHVV